MDEATRIAVSEKPGPVADILSWIELLNGWGTIGLAILVFAVGWMFWRLNSGNTPYRFGDTLIDPMTGKGSILRTAFLLALLWGIGIVSYCVLVKQTPPSEIMGILALVVAPMIAGRYFETRDPRVVAQAQTMTEPPPSAPPTASAEANLETK